MVRLIEQDEFGYVLFFYRHGDEHPINYKKAKSAKNAKSALYYVGKEMFSKLSGYPLKKAMKLKELGTQYVLLTDSLTGRKICQMPIEDFIKDYGSEAVYNAWLSDFEDFV